MIKVIVGMRRSGKSYLMRQVISLLSEEFSVSAGKIICIDKESLYFDYLRTYKDLYYYVINNKPDYLFIDEAQEITEWEKPGASFNNEGIDVYFTGPNSKMLYSNLATYLAGRYVTIPIYTLGFQEFIDFQQKQALAPPKAFEDYLRLGGFPISAQFHGEDSRVAILIRDIFEPIILKEIIVQNKIRRVNLLHSIIHYIIDNIDNAFSDHKVANYLKSQRIKLDVETVQDYLGYLVSTFALHRVRRYDIYGKRHLEIGEKYYLGDLGLRQALLGYRASDINQFLENIVCLQLLRDGSRVSVDKLGDLEIDFITEHGEKKQ